ncbi:hypothetical protein QZH41_003742 [Actinostola sp. cb2023]|nr:hypothetical protein QZH41_003742 [Actinostola sp. cb2023]
MIAANLQQAWGDALSTPIKGRSCKEHFDVLLAHHKAGNASALKKGETWSDNEVKALIAIWRDDKVLKMLNTTHKNSDIYKKMSTEMLALGYNRDYMQCRTKLKHLKTEYTKYNDQASRTGEGRAKTTKYFDEINAFWGDCPEAKGIEGAIDSTADLEEVNLVYPFNAIIESLKMRSLRNEYSFKAYLANLGSFHDVV